MTPQLSAARAQSEHADPAWTLASSLAIAARGRGMSFIALPAPVVAVTRVLAAWPSDAPAVAWSHGELALVGLGVADELRGRGESRWDQLVAGARARAGVGAIDGAIFGGAVHPVSALGAARPRWIGGAAFAPGAADRAPWSGFGDAWFALPRWTYSHDGANAWLVLAVSAREAATEAARWTSELALIRAALEAPAPAPAGERGQPPIRDIDPGDASAWRARVTAITDAIARGGVAKVVAARTCVVSLAGDAHAADLLATLEARHGECARVLVRPPGGGTLIAATPERLVRRDGDVVACDALAGTIERSGWPDRAAPPNGGAESIARTDNHDVQATALRASDKDRREHELVVRAITSALASAGADVEAPGEPGVRELRHMLHLHTPIRATLRAPLHVLELAARLHPTPAMGGTPTPAAVAWIAAHEAPRGWYASPVGWFDLDGNGELAVAIRAGVVAGARVHLWAGAGIVAGSDPDRELAETDVKLRPMLGALGRSA